MAAIKEEIFEWDPQVREIAQESIIESKEKDNDVQEKQKIQKSFLKKMKDMIENKEGLGYAIIMNTFILIGSIMAISLCVVIGGLLMDPFLILSILLVVLLGIVLEVFKLAEKQTRCKNSR